MHANKKQHSFFLNFLKDAFEYVKELSSLSGFREKSWNLFLEKGLPQQTLEAFKYVPLFRLYENSYEPVLDAKVSLEEIVSYIYPECKESYFVFIDGALRLELSNTKNLPPQVVALPLEEARKTYSTILQSRWTKTLKEEQDPFALLNLALHPGGLFIYVPPKVVIKTPVQVLYLSTKENSLSMPRTQIFAGSQSEIQWITTAKNCGGWVNSVLDVSLEDSSLFKGVDLQKKSVGWDMSSFRATLKKDASIHHVSPIAGQDVTRKSYRVSLNGTGASAELQGVWMLEESRQSHIHALVEHTAPHCRSLQRFKGVLADVSRSSFEGKIWVDPVAQKTEAYQLNHNLILGERAVANSKPNLEIFADDVKASHGATITQLNADELFYLRSRGLSAAESKSLLIRGFCQEILSEIPYQFVQSEMETYVHTIESKSV